MAARRPRMGPSPLVIVVLLAALGVGVATAVITGVRTAGPPPPVGPSQGILIPAWVLAAAVLGFFLLLLGLTIYDRVQNGGGAIPGRFIVFVLTILLVMIVFVAIAHVLGFTGGGIEGQSSSKTPVNGTTPPPNSTGTNLTGNGSTLSAPTFHLPPWALFVVVVVVAVAIAGVGAPRLFEYIQDRRAERWSKKATNEAALALKDALGRAGEDLDRGKDPREVILALYAQLLVQLRPLVTDVEHDTPEEIRHRHLVRLGVRAAAAEELTRVFEEARYSTHPIGSDEVTRASTAIHDAEEDLRRSLAGR